MSCLQEIRVIDGHDNTAGLVFGMVAADGTAALYNFASVTRMTLEFDVGGVPTVIDSDLTPAAIDWTAGDGEITFALGHEGIPLGSYPARLYIYSVAYPAGYLMDVDDSGFSAVLTVI